ncbi:hypothetical protein BSO21_08955 [Paenibacillus odorifer]|uniref:Uncharacterized protein n=1 Tax=Paenibacillus odorifer TaxID=189426 RepID=A0ABX3GSD2_9BACL|nr:hypothetical protein BSO21_08955 [Paenibacillus odorifer]
MAGGVLFTNCSDSVALISTMYFFSTQIKGNKSYTVRNLRNMNPYAGIAAIRSDTIKIAQRAADHAAG